MQKNKPLIVLLACLSIISGAATLFFIISYLNKIAIARHATFQQAIATTQQTDNQIDRFIKVLETTTKNLVAFIGDNPVDSKIIQQELLKKPLFITGSGCIIFNKANKQATGLYYVEKNGQQQLISLTDQSAFVIDPTPFFEAIKNNSDSYMGPLIDPFTGEKVIVYAHTITRNDTSVVLFSTQSLNHLHHVLNTLYMGKQGYWFIVDTHDQIIIHPRTPMTNHPTLQDLAKITDTPALTTLTKKANGTLTYTNEVTHQPSWLIYQKIISTGWLLCGVFEQMQAELPHDENRQYLILISSGLLLLFLLIMGIITLLFASVRTHQWMLTALASCACIATIGIVWYAAKRYPIFVNYDAAHTITPIENKVELYRFLDHVSKKKDIETESLDDKKLDYYLAYRYKVGRYIPTGTFIHYMHFVSPSQVQIVGYVWQRYFEGTHDGIMRGFVLPQATSDASITEVFHTKIGRQETIIWRVNATLNQNFSYIRYPFDTREITIQLWHADFGQNIVLVPDLDSYPLLTQTSLPGLSGNAYIPNWQFESSYFGYQSYLYNTLFGLYTYGPFGIYNLFNKSYTPELHFVVTTQRLLMDTLIDDLLPLFLIALLLFVVFITDIGHGYQVFAAYASIFFGIVVAQLHFRGKIPSNQLVYFENIYVIMYLALIITLLFTFLKLQSTDPNSPQLRRGKIAEILYWPILLSSIVLLTVFYLY